MGLVKYHAKRQFNRTPEPKGDAPKRSKKDALLYVIQKHAASRLHYDFRLEYGGVLWSWAVPKGPSFDTHDKRLAVHVEDHPMEYRDFEGIIPKGQYGGGSVMVWDRGTWEPLGDADAMYREGKLKFVVHGTKLRGAWTLVRMSGRAAEEGKNWLLIKERDDEVRSHDAYDVTAAEPNSVLSGRTMDEIAADADAVWQSGRKQSAAAVKSSKPTKGEKPTTPRKSKLDASALTGAKKVGMPHLIEPQLATLAEQVPSGKDWLHELKLDGYRMLAFVGAGKTRLMTRKGLDWTTKFATVAKAAQGVSAQAVFDGEVCVVREDGTTDFQALQNALSEDNQAKLVYYVFDMPWCDGYDIREAPLHERKALLKQVLASAPALGSVLIYGDHLEGQGEAIWKHACEMGMEGIIAKKRDAKYVGKRLATWLKIKCHLRQELVIGGYSEPQGTRVGFGALLLGYYENDELIYAGRVGTGFDQKWLDVLYTKMKKLERKTPAFENPPKGAEARDAHWIDPKLVAEVKFAEWTSDGHVRQAVFEGLREDKPAEDVKRERPTDVRNAEPKAVKHVKRESFVKKPVATPVSESAAKAVKSSRKDEKPRQIGGIRVTHPSRLVYPDIGLTKGDLVDYYARAAARILPYVSHRPLSIVRCPDGQGHPCFFQKHLGAHASEPGLFGIEVKDKENKGDYLVVRDSVGLLMTVQLGALELHPWASHEDKLEYPEWMVFDLDPGEGVVWDRVLEGALVLRARLDELGLTSYVRTSGGKGLHVVVPLARKNDWDEIKAFSKLVTEELERREPKKYVSVMTKRERGGRIFVDYLRNGRGATAVANFSTRAREGCPIAVPVDWRELDKITSGDQFNYTNIDVRLRKPDPWADFFETKQSITKAMLNELSP